MACSTQLCILQPAEFRISTWSRLDLWVGSHKKSEPKLLLLKTINGKLSKKRESHVKFIQLVKISEINLANFPPRGEIARIIHRRILPEIQWALQRQAAPDSYPVY